MKSLTLISILAVSVLCISVAVQANNVTWGHVGRYDRLLAINYVRKKPAFFGNRTVTVKYPQKGNIKYATISAIKAWDYGGPESFGNAALTKGGPGYRNATILLTSQSGKGLNFTIQYYGH